MDALGCDTAALNQAAVFDVLGVKRGSEQTSHQSPRSSPGLTSPVFILHDPTSFIAPVIIYRSTRALMYFHHPHTLVYELDDDEE